MDFTKRANDESVAYFHATMVLFQEWLLEMSSKMAIALLVLLVQGETDEANSIKRKLAKTMTDAAKLIESVGSKCGECLIVIDGLAVEVVRYDEPHSLTQQDLVANVLDFGKKGADIMQTMIGHAEAISESKFPQEETESLKKDFRYFLDKALETA